MFVIKREKDTINLVVLPSIPGAENWEYYFQRREHDEPTAQMLINAINERMRKVLKRDRQEYYNRGYRDAKAKCKKADWIDGWW